LNLQLAGRRALVSGSTAGIGFAIAQALLAEGAAVTINGRTPAGVEAALARLRAAQPGAEVNGVAADLATAAGCEALADDAGGAAAVDILVNNLGIFDPQPFEDITDAAWQRFFEVNVMSGVRLARVLLPGMKARNWGRVIFVSSESGVCPPPEMVHYGMTKSAQLSISRGLAETCAGSGVTVNAVLPGPTRTEGAVAFFGKLAEQAGQSLKEAERDFFAHARPTSIIKRFVEPAEVAAMVAFVCSPLAAATNGATLKVDGGVVRSLI
jgi:NAD(P)-dependent dehydrogenase (short-subunit alcohol dehydrogenase family)